MKAVLKNNTVYKNSIIGQLPNDWAVLKIKEFTKTVTGGTPSTFISEYWDGDIKWMSSGDLNKKKVFNVIGRITEESLKNSNARLLPVKCVLVGLAGQGKTRGTVAINMVELCTNQSVAAILPNEKFIPEYLYYNLDFRYDELRRLSTGDGGRGGLNLKIISSIVIPFPNITEQRNIAEVILSWDTAIETIEKLIEAKQQLKKGLIQKLLNSENRMWRTVLFEDIFNYIKTESYTRENLTYNTSEAYIYYIHYGDIHSTYANQIIDLDKESRIPLLKAEYNSRNYTFLQDGDLIIADASEDYIGVGECIELKNVRNKKIIGGLHTIVVRDKEGRTAPGYRCYILLAPSVSKALKKIATGFSVFGISKTNLSKLQIRLPSITEQQKIAKLLSICDTEIDNLNSQLVKLEEQKKGLMQVLLTGKVRVKI